MAAGAEIGAMPIDFEGANAAVRDEGTKICDDVVEAASASGVAAEGHCIASDPADALLDVAESVHADLIVVGNRGMTGKRRILGSVPNSVSHHCRTSLLIVDTKH
jgi:nucleotide-binding universal stress UspA family protein